MLITVSQKGGASQATKILVCDALFQKTSYAHLFDHIPFEKVELFLNIARLVYLMGKDGHESLIQLLKLLLKYYPTTSVGWLPTPHNMSMFQSCIINPSNKYSFIGMLPIPRIIYQADQEHAFCPLKEGLSYFVFFSQLNWI